MASCSSPSPFKFQSTLPQGKWPVQRGRKSYDWRISIHTSAREVTVINITELQKMRISIHTSAREVTLLNNLHDHADKFQSTLPQGKWRYLSDIQLYGSYFNPHFRKGSDRSFGWFSPSAPRFQSTLPQGKWLISFPSFPMIYIFQSTLPQGKWQMLIIAIVIFRQFQSTLPQGKWQTVVSGILWPGNFNPHFRKGSDTTLGNDHLPGLQFQSTLPQGKWHSRSSGPACSMAISIHTSAREVTS